MRNFTNKIVFMPILLSINYQTWLPWLLASIPRPEHVQVMQQCPLLVVVSARFAHSCSKKAFVCLETREATRIDIFHLLHQIRVQVSHGEWNCVSLFGANWIHWCGSVEQNLIITWLEMVDFVSKQLPRHEWSQEMSACYCNLIKQTIVDFIIFNLL